MLLVFPTVRSSMFRSYVRDSENNRERERAREIPFLRFLVLLNKRLHTTTQSQRSGCLWISIWKQQQVKCFFVRLRGVVVPAYSADSTSSNLLDASLVNNIRTACAVAASFFSRSDPMHHRITIDDSEATVS